MKRLFVLVIILILLSPSLASAEPSTEKLPQQDVFNISVVLQIQPAEVGNNSSWIGKFQLNVVLVNREYRDELERIAQNNSEAARQLFWQIINNTVYTSLKYDIADKFSGTGVKPIFVLPQQGPIELRKNWSAVVYLGVANFFVERGHYLTSPVAGDLKLWIANKTYSMDWTKFVVVLPRSYELASLKPEPSVFQNGIAVWYNGSYVPNVTLYTPGYSFVRFLNETKNQTLLRLRYTPGDGHLYFEAVFPKDDAPGIVKAMLLYTLRKTLQPLSIDVFERNGTINVVGVAVPPAKKEESWHSTSWKAYVNLPFPFAEIEVQGASYRLLSPVLVEITYEKSKWNWLAYIGGGIFVIFLAVIYLRNSRKKENMKEIAEEEESTNSEAVEGVE